MGLAVLALERPMQQWLVKNSIHFWGKFAWAIRRKVNVSGVWRSAPAGYQGSQIKLNVKVLFFSVFTWNFFSLWVWKTFFVCKSSCLVKVDTNTARSEWGECVYECGSTIHLPYIRCLKLVPALYQVLQSVNCPISVVLKFHLPPILGALKFHLPHIRWPKIPPSMKLFSRNTFL